ncbi:TIGR02301 family protein [Beijerinckia indica]|uniref:TIGR02301 family protein n=1 Tax=Beijerinckia indica subsp. indica (strain ATCC 9039 / DSM 1715 / NCIMB 8712) TaxID=395963 RepID=B2IGI3_BEII9|nr:TIGR02301 family protein [Beijerinckia indica]ACB94365.1 conserved hypothetical protein [Beijerinckia indica subsp. indica ATCC 9039]
MVACFRFASAMLVVVPIMANTSAWAQWDWFEGVEKPAQPSRPVPHSVPALRVPPRSTPRPDRSTAASPGKKHHERPHSHDADPKPAHKKKGQAKQESTKAAPDSNSPSQPVERKPAPYEGDLLRLAEILGALSYLETLCGGRTENWSARMTALMEAEAGGEQEKERLAGAYNRGLRDYQLSYRLCTPNAQAIIARFFAEGARISHSVIDRYGAY